MTPTSALNTEIRKGGWLTSRLSNAWFAVRVLRLCTLRAFKDLLASWRGDVGLIHTTQSVNAMQAWQHIAGESKSKLWTSTAAGDSALVAGKVQNLRIAALHLNGLSVGMGHTFSFWKAVGLPTRLRGFVKGRELREGCLIASVGGGLCQMSNALYAAAVDAGLEIVERHAHTQIVPGSLAEQGRDATVFWNYVDLRFRHHADFTICVSLSEDQLLVQIRLKQAKDLPAYVSTPRRTGSGTFIPVRSEESAHDCVACEQTACVDNIKPSPSEWRTAYLLDAVWPEYDRWIAAHVKPGDLSLVPLHGALRHKRNYHWNFLAEQSVQCVEHFGLTTYRSLVSRFLPPQGAVRQRQLLAMNAAFARAYARKLPAETRHLVESVTLLADLWRLGVLGGRSYEVLMTRAPLRMLHDSLDQAAQLHPNSPTLQDFRADAQSVCAEDMALAGARTLVTPHHAVANFVAARYNVRVEQLEWHHRPSPRTDSRPRSKVLFPASALGRKGAYEVRETCRALGIPLQCLGSAQDAAGFWQGLPAERVDAQDMFNEAMCVVLPAFVEHRPDILLRAIEKNVPVICSPACGIPAGTPNVLLVRAGSVPDLMAAMRTIQSRLG